MPTDPSVALETTFDFINTLEQDLGTTTDHIPSAEAAIDWLVANGALHGEDAETARAPLADERAAAALLGKVRGARASLREIADAVVARRPPAQGAVDEVNRMLRASEIVQLEPAPDGVTVASRCVADPLEDAFARLAEPLVTEIASGRPERLRVCANDTCRWVFFDSSPAARRRWCSMDSCGNRAKAARHRARRRAETKRV